MGIRSPEFSDALEEIGRQIVDAAIKVHMTLGPGLLESVYESCLAHELRKGGFMVRTQVILPVVYDGEELQAGLRLDVLVNDQVIIEVKAVEQMLPLFEAQMLTYLKLTGCKLGYLINFNVPRVRSGIKRIVRSL